MAAGGIFHYPVNPNHEEGTCIHTPVYAHVCLCVFVLYVGEGALKESGCGTHIASELLF